MDKNKQLEPPDIIKGLYNSLTQEEKDKAIHTMINGAEEMLHQIQRELRPVNEAATDQEIRAEIETNIDKAHSAAKQAAEKLLDSIGEALKTPPEEFKKTLVNAVNSGFYKDNKDVLELEGKWPEITGLSWEELDKLTFREIVQLVREAQKRKPYLMLPSGPSTNLTKKILNNPTRVSSKRRGQIKQADHYLTGDSIITYKGNDSTLTITLGQTKKLFSRGTKNGPKIFNFLLQKLNEQNWRETTTFQLIELVDNGIYANKDSAAKGLKNALEKMYAISIEGVTTEYEGGKKKNATYAKSRLVAAFKVSYNECSIILTPIIRNNAKSITILPKWSYKLSEPSYMLLDYIYFLARQSTEAISKNGYFNISLEAVRTQLGLPTPDEAGRHPQQLIIEPIEKAITDIEGEILKGGAELKITPIYNLNYKKVSEYLEGYLKIEPDGTAINYYTQLQDNKKKPPKRKQITGTKKE